MNEKPPQRCAFEERFTISPPIEHTPLKLEKALKVDRCVAIRAYLKRAHASECVNRGNVFNREVENRESNQLRKLRYKL